MGHAQVSQSFDGAGKLGNRSPAREESEGLWLSDWEIGFLNVCFQSQCRYVFVDIQKTGKRKTSVTPIHLHTYIPYHIAERYIRINQSINRI